MHDSKVTARLAVIMASRAEFLRDFAADAPFFLNVIEPPLESAADIVTPLMCISLEAVHARVRSLYEKLYVHSLTCAALRCLEP
jgi:hypothetical protein